MTGDLDPLISDLLRWIAGEPRTLAEVLDAWRTSCPRLTVWEDACDRGLVIRGPGGPRSSRISLTPAGERFLQSGEMNRH